jgi:selenoprotein W-related protein
MTKYQHIITDLQLVTGDKGIFDVIVDGDMLYSKHDTGRHAEPGEVLELFRDKHAADVAVYGT